MWNKVKEELKQQPFLSKDRRPWLHTFLNSAQETENTKLMSDINWPWKDSIDLESLIFPDVRFFNLQDTKEKKAHTVLFGVFSEYNGCFAAKILKTKKGLESRIFDVYFDHSRVNKHGIARNFLDFLRSDIYAQVPVTRETLKADYVGRYVWAKLGFKFSKSYWLKENKSGPALKLWEMARANLRRFLIIHNIKESDLSCPINMLKDPIDFAQLKATKKVTSCVLDGADFLSNPVEMEIGKAFMLGDYRPSGQHIISMSRAHLSNIHMPYWNGYRIV